MILLGAVVGILAGLATYLFELLLHAIKAGLVSWFPIDVSHPLLVYPVVGIILVTLCALHRPRQHIGGGDACSTPYRGVTRSPHPQHMELGGGIIHDSRIWRFGRSRGTYRPDGCGDRLYCGAGGASEL